jgi:hypothetical protein
MGVLRGIHILAAASTLDGTSWIVSRSRGFTAAQRSRPLVFFEGEQRKGQHGEYGGVMMVIELRVVANASLLCFFESCIGHGENQIVVGFKCS